MHTYIQSIAHQYKSASSLGSRQHRFTDTQQERVETTAQKKRRMLQLQSMATQKQSLRRLLCHRLNQAMQQNNVELVRQLRREWAEMFPDIPSPI